MPLNIPGVPFRLTAEEATGTPDYGQAFHQGLLNYGKEQESINTPRKLAAELLEKQLKNKYYGREKESEIGLRSAQQGLAEANTGLAPYHKNLYEAQANYYNNGGAGGSTGSKDYFQYSNGVKKDNPDLSPDQLKEAEDVIAAGGNVLSDGTQLNPVSIGTKTALDRTIKATTTAAQLNSSLGAHQAESEIDVLQKYANQGLKKYGTTYFDKSPQQILDTFKSDPNSQKDLGKLIAAQALQFEIAQQRIKLANGQPGVTSTNELVNLSKQTINTKFPKLTSVAREEAARYINEALKEGLKARDKSGVGAGNTYKFTAQANDNSEENLDSQIQKFNQNITDESQKISKSELQDLAKKYKKSELEVLKMLSQPGGYNG